ncbi:MAG: S-layer homology domain-containing protein [Elainellaceae cyanobacterium]
MFTPWKSVLRNVLRCWLAGVESASLKFPLAWLCLGLSASLLPLSARPAYGQTYTDVEGHWAESCIQQLSQQNVTSGYPDGTFRPDAVITRAEYAALLNQAFPTVEPEREAISFTDVPDDYWGQEAIRTAYQRGFLSGYPGQTFRPDRLIERAEAFVSLASGLDYSLPAAPEPLLASAFADADAIPAYAEAPLAAALQQGILITQPPEAAGRLMRPRNPATRSQMAAALCQIAFEDPAIPAEYVVNPPQSDGVAPIALDQTCTNETIGYTIGYPAGWQTNPGQVIESCRVFDPQSITLPEQAESTDEAIHLRVDNVAFDRVTQGNISARELSRQTIEVDGYQAIATENESTGRGLLPEGMRFYQYAINLEGDRTFIATTYDVSDNQYERNKRVLDQMISSLDFT